MSELKRTEMLDLFNKVEDAVTFVLKDKAIVFSDLNQGEKPHEMARVINDTLSIKTMQGSTIQQNYYNKLKKSKDEYFKISDDYLNKFQSFVELINSKRGENHTQGTNSTRTYVYTPFLPEFPEGNPAFPASPHHQIPIPEFKRVWIKDESYNPTGTHKDRKAYELLTYIEGVVRNQQNNEEASGRRRPVEYPPVSIISSGNEAYAIQALFAQKGYRDLRVILDKKHKYSPLAKELESLGCKLWFEDLDNGLKTGEVLRITDNETGRDLTTYLNADLIKKRYKFYDWLSFEILNLSPEFCFIPVGTGDLFLNVLEFNKMEIEKHRANGERDTRFFGHIDKLSNCNFIGASTENSKSKAVKLYTKYNSCFEKPFQDHIQEYINNGFCGKATGTYPIDEEYLEVAMEYLDKLNIPAEYSGAAGLAVFFSMMDSIAKDKTIVIVNTGKLKIKSDVETEEKMLKKIMDRVKKIKRKVAIE